MQNQKNYETLFVVLNNLCQINLHEKNYDQAIDYATKATELAKVNFGARTMDYIKSLNNLLSAHIEKGNFSTATTLLSETIALCKEVMGAKASLLGRLYYNASILAARTRDFSLANFYIDSSNTITLEDFRNNFYTLSEKEKLTWWQDRAHQFDLAPSLLMKTSSNAIIENFTDKQLQLKGFVLNDAATALRRARASGNAKLKTLIDAWQQARTLLSKQTSLTVAERSFSLDSLQQSSNDLEKQINQESAGLLKQTSETISWKNIQSALSNDEAAIEFVRFRYFQNEWTDTVQYAALIIRRNNSPQFVPLGNENQISFCLTGAKNNDKETNINRLYRSTITGNKNTGKFLGDSLYKLIWGPLLPYLQGVNTVSYAADGLLHKVAFHALPVAGNKILIDQYRLQQYTSIRQLANRKETIDTNWPSVFLLGNPDFNYSSAKAGSSPASKNSWNVLPGTAKEITGLQQLFASRSVKINLVSSNKASEETYKKLNGQSPSIMHLATHGFFLPDPAKTTTDTISLKFQNPYQLSPDPLMRSGIILSGGNHAWNGEKLTPGTEDGILTAYEIAQMDLHNTQLVVLSACETALGDLQGAEGVFGLQRAFKIAGVKNMVLSLWQVPDKETVELMTAFYTNLLSGKPVREAFYLAQKDMHTKYSPFFWAAFVLVE
jgi:CHAT domain-containing protein